MRLDRRIAIVTGAAKGIGAATVELFAAEGAIVYAADLEVIDAPSDSVRPVALDVTDDEAWARFVEQVVAEAGRIDVLMNNAGIVKYYGGITEITPEQWDEVIRVNQTGPFLGMRHVIPVMQKQQAGSIINVSSIWGIAGAAGVAAYTASKGAVRLMSKNAALTYVSDGIRVNSLHPGIIATPLIDAQDEAITADIVGVTPMGRLGRPEEIANGALFLASDESSYMTGAELVIDGGYTTP